MFSINCRQAWKFRRRGFAHGSNSVVCSPKQKSKNEMIQLAKSRINFTRGFSSLASEELFSLGNRNRFVEKASQIKRLRLHTKGDPASKGSAAVLIPLVTVDGRPSLLFTARSKHLRSHAGIIYAIKGLIMCHLILFFVIFRWNQLSRRKVWSKPWQVLAGCCSERDGWGAGHQQEFIWCLGRAAASAGQGWQDFCDSYCCPNQSIFISGP